MNFRLANEKDIDNICRILKNLISKKYKGLNWDEEYPNREIIIRDIREKELFVLENNNGIVGSVVLNSIGEEAYDDLNWKSEMPQIYVHRLFVNPEIKGKGYGKALMEACREYLLTKGYRSIRLDTFSENESAQSFYEKQGFEKVGQVFIKGYTKAFFCYEKNI